MCKNYAVMCKDCETDFVRTVRNGSDTVLLNGNLIKMMSFSSLNKFFN